MWTGRESNPHLQDRKPEMATGTRPITRYDEGERLQEHCTEGGNFKNMTNILAIDYGRKRIGLAYSVLYLAEPLKILENNAQLFANLKKVINEYEIERILLGISDREMAEETKNFALELKKQIDLPVIFYDESYSSQITHEKLLNSSMKQSRRQLPIDHFAAAHFLQEWLDENIS